MAKQNNKKRQVEDLSYPPSDDIYNKLEEATEIDPEDTTRKKVPIWPAQKKNVHDFDDDLIGDDLDIPDYDSTDISTEDEENSYHSLGGDNHLDLEEEGHSFFE